MTGLRRPRSPIAGVLGTPKEDYEVTQHNNFGNSSEQHDNDYLDDSRDRNLMDARRPHLGVRT